MRATARALCSRRWHYERMGLDARTIRFLPDGSVGEGAAGCERWWNLRRMPNLRDRPGPLEIEVFGEDGLTFRARRTGRMGWRGAWVIFERAPVVLKPIPAPRLRAEKRALPPRHVPPTNERGTRIPPRKPAPKAHTLTAGRNGSSRGTALAMNGKRHR